MSKKIRVGEDTYEKWHIDPLGVEEGDHIGFTFKPPGADELSEKTGTVTYVAGEGSRYSNILAVVDVDDAGKWRFKCGAVEIKTSKGTRYHGSLIDIEVE